MSKRRMHYIPLRDDPAPCSARGARIFGASPDPLRVTCRSCKRWLVARGLLAPPELRVLGPFVTTGERERRFA